nr:MAG: putative RNA-dependent RNA polymerase [Picobirnavirus sp.]
MATKKDDRHFKSLSQLQEAGYFLSSFKTPNPGLRAYFEHVRSGNDEEYRTPFFKGKSLEDILSGWDSTLDQIGERWPSLLEFEKDLRKKVGPMSIMRPLQERMDDIDSYYESILLDSKPISDAALQATVDWFKPLRGLRLRSEERTVELMKKSTNSGSPFFAKRKTVIDDTVPCDVLAVPEDAEYNGLGVPVTIQYLQEFGTRIRGARQYSACAVLGWRGQEGGPTPDDVKQRVVWMFPFAVNIAELRLYQPLIEGCQSLNLVPAWVGMDKVDEEITHMFDTKGPEDLVVCTDFSKFDQHFNSDMQHAARYILSNLLNNSAESNAWLNQVFPIKYEIPLAYDYRKVAFGKHGMGSGSGGTNADETLVHRALQYEAAQSHGSELNPHSQCLGDDGLLTYPGITVEDVVRVYSSHGQEMNLDKQYASKQDCTYLRRWHHKDYRINNVCVGVYSTYRALGRLAEQERFYDPETWGPEMVALRQLSILENVKWHPLREEFVTYCMKGDKYRLGLDLPGFFDNIEAIAKEATDLMPDFLGYTKSLQHEARDHSSTGISSWWIVQYLKSLT